MANQSRDRPNTSQPPDEKQRQPGGDGGPSQTTGLEPLRTAATATTASAVINATGCSAGCGEHSAHSRAARASRTGA